MELGVFSIFLSFRVEDVGHMRNIQCQMREAQVLGVSLRFNSLGYKIDHLGDVLFSRKGGKERKNITMTSTHPQRGPLILSGSRQTPAWVHLKVYIKIAVRIPSVQPVSIHVKHATRDTTQTQSQ